MILKLYINNYLQQMSESSHFMQRILEQGTHFMPLKYFEPIHSQLLAISISVESNKHSTIIIYNVYNFIIN